MAKKTQNIQPDERAFQTWFKENFVGWKSQVHPGLSADPGLPDLLLLLNTGNVTPCELKIGSVSEEDGKLVLWTKEVRASQIRWHSTLANSGGISLLVCGVWGLNGWRVFSINAAIAKQWHETGFEIGVDAIEIAPDDLLEGLTSFVVDWVE